MIIAIVGKAQHGKDTLGKMLAEELFDKTGFKYVLMAYATELKRRVHKDFDLSYEQLWGNEKEKADFRYPKRGEGTSSNPSDYWTAREIMQEYGQFYRNIDPDFWVKALYSVIDDKGYDNVIITDARHPNEADPVKKRGGITIRIVRNVETGIHNQEHISEIALDNYDVDFEIKNFGDLDTLRNAAKELVQILSSKKEIKIIGGDNG
jgi:cytidylate kinase